MFGLFKALKENILIMFIYFYALELLQKKLVNFYPLMTQNNQNVLESKIFALIRSMHSGKFKICCL